MIENIEKMEDHPFFQALLTLPMWAQYVLTQSRIFSKKLETVDRNGTYKHYCWVPSFRPLIQNSLPTEQLNEWYDNRVKDKSAELKKVITAHGLTMADLDNLYIGYFYPLDSGQVYECEKLFWYSLDADGCPVAKGLLSTPNWEDLDLREEHLRLGFAGQYITQALILPYVKDTALEERRDSICRTFMELSTTFEISGYRRI